MGFALLLAYAYDVSRYGVNYANPIFVGFAILLFAIGIGTAQYAKD